MPQFKKYHTAEAIEKQVCTNEDLIVDLRKHIDSLTEKVERMEKIINAKDKFWDGD